MTVMIFITLCIRVICKLAGLANSGNIKPLLLHIDSLGFGVVNHSMALVQSWPSRLFACCWYLVAQLKVDDEASTQ